MKNKNFSTRKVPNIHKSTDSGVTNPNVPNFQFQQFSAFAIDLVFYFSYWESQEVVLQ